MTYGSVAAPIVVMGLMGAGKTTVARLLAAALDRPLRDSDADLAARYGMTAAEINAREGVATLHAREAEVLLDALAQRPPAVIAAAASTVDGARTRAALGRAFVVFLDGPPEVLAERMRSGAHRPRFQPDLAAMLTEQRARRLAAFQSVADVVFDSGAHAPERIAAGVLDALGSAAEVAGDGG